MTSQRLIAAYDEIAADYAARHREVSHEWSQFGRRTLALATPPTGPVELLDLGCGSGRDLPSFAARGATVVGGDLSAAMLAEARKRWRGPLVRLDMRLLPFPGGRFDAIWCSAALLHLPKQEAPAALAEANRVLRPGGVLAVTLKRGSGEAWEPVPYRPAIERFFSRWEPEAAAALVAAAGLRVVDLDSVAVGHERWIRILAVTPG